MLLVVGLVISLRLQGKAERQEEIRAQTGQQGPVAEYTAGVMARGERPDQDTLRDRIDNENETLDERIEEARDLLSREAAARRRAIASGQGGGGDSQGRSTPGGPQA